MGRAKHKAVIAPEVNQPRERSVDNQDNVEITQSVTVTLPGIPRGKGRPRFVRATGRTYTDAQTESYEGALKWAAKSQMHGNAPMEGPLAVTMIAEFAIPASWSKKRQSAAMAREVRPTGKPDADNLLKTLDALNEVVWKDDAQVVEAHISKHYGRNPGVTIIVSPVIPVVAEARAAA